MFLAALYKKAAHAKALNDIIEKQINKILAHGRDLATAANPAETSANGFEQTDAAYALASVMVESALQEKLDRYKYSKVKSPHLKNKVIQSRNDTLHLLPILIP